MRTALFHATAPCSGVGRAVLALLATLVPAGTVAAQLQPQASYPLLTDLLDATNTYGPVMLTGNPTPPAPPANGVCQNGIYSLSPGGQDIRTPMITSLNTNDLQIDVEFNLAALPASRGPVLMGGYLYRWLGIYVQSNGIVGMKHNNSNLAWSTTTLTTGRWYIASLRYENGTAELHIDGHMVMQVPVGPLNTGNYLNFTTNDFSNGGSFNGCIRNLVISNDTTLGAAAAAQPYGHGCAGLTMSAVGVPKVGNGAFGLRVAGVSATVTPLVYVGIGQRVVSPGFDLTPIGMTSCASFTSLDLGIFGPAVAMSGAGTLPLPIPNDPTLAGLVLFTQGIASAMNPLGLGAANGTMLVVGM